MEVYWLRSSNSLYLLVLYTLRLTVAVKSVQDGQNLCSTFSTITFDPTATFTLGPAEGCFVLQPRPLSKSATVTSSTSLSIVRRCPAAAHDAPLVDGDPCAEDSTNRTRSAVIITAEGYTNTPSASLFTEGSTAVTTIGRFITQTVQEQVVSTTSTADLQVSASERLDPEAPLSVPSVAASTNLGQLIARPFQTTPNLVATPLTQIAPLAQTTSSSVISSTISLQTETIGSATTTDDPGSLQSEIPTGDVQAPEYAPLAAEGDPESAASSEVPIPVLLPPVKTSVFTTAFAGAVTPGQSITYFPTVCLAPSYSPSISIITQYQTITVTATPNSTSSSKFSPDTTFHLSIVTIAPTGASSAVAAPSSKSEAGANWTRWRSAFAVFEGLLVSLYVTVG